jgi:metallo-beta-lactamase class B
MNAGKGNLADANLKEWSNTVGKIKEKFSSAKIVVPGHGRSGGIELLDFTINLFDSEREK